MTRQYNDNPDKATQFSLWLRRLESPLDSQTYTANNLDYIWLNYREDWLITIEEKRYGRQPTKSQLSTFNILRQMLEYASGTTVRNYGRQYRIEYRGHYYVIFENTSPEDSQYVSINGKQYQEVEKAIKYLLSHGTIPPPRPKYHDSYHP